MTTILHTALLAAVAMVVEDILGTVLVQANAKNRAWLSGLLDALAWGAGIFTTSVSVTALQGHNMTAKVIVIGAVTAANIIGSVAGVKIGERLLRVPEARHARKRIPRKRTSGGF